MINPKSTIEFMGIAEGLKRELRHSWLSDGRRESVAEHSWAMSLLALLMLQDIEEKVDKQKVLMMIIIHDLVEVYATDIPAFEVTNMADKKQKIENEKKAMDKLLINISNPKTRSLINTLWNEFEEGKTIEAKIAIACDKAEVIIQHNLADISTFTKGDFDLNPYYKENLFQFNNEFKALKRQIDIDTMEKIEKADKLQEISTEYKERWNKEKLLNN